MAETSDAGAGGGSSVLRDALITVATRLGLAVLILATDVAIARLLGPAAKGRFTLVLLFGQLAALALGLGLDRALGVVAARSKDVARRGFANAILWVALVGGFGVLASLALYGVPGTGAARGPLTALIPNLSTQQFLFGALAVPGELFFAIGLIGLLGRRRVLAYNAIRLLRRGVLLLVVIATAAAARLSLDVALLVNLLALAVSAGAICFVAARERVLGIVPSLPLLGEQLRYGTRSMPGALAERLQFRADAFLLNFLLGVSATGVYSVASGLAETLWYIPNALGVVMFSRAVGPGSGAARVASVMTRATLAVALALALPIALLAPWLVEVVYGPAFRPAGVALQILLPGIVAYSVVAILSNYVLGKGAPGLNTLVFLAGLSVNLIANWLLIPVLGINGAAAASSLSYGITAVLTLIAFSRLSGQGWRETLLLRRSDLAAVGSAGQALRDRLAGRPASPAIRDEAEAELILHEHEPGEER
ncbi:hypothetical protein BH20CHL6_BH20CHL6_17890 [soil metagenome]